MNKIQISTDAISTTVLQLGFEGENNHTQVVIYCSTLFSKYPNAEASMVIKPPVGDMYPKIIERDGVKLLWTVTAADCANPGSGQYQLTFTDDGEIIKTFIGNFNVYQSLSADGEAPDPVQDWLQEANNALNNLDDTITAAADAWLAENITNPDSPPLDSTLTSNSAAAPAGVVGELKSMVSGFALAGYTPLSWKPTITKGSYIAFANGKISSSNKYARTALIKGYQTRIAAHFAGASTYEFDIFYYDSTGNLSTGAGYLGHYPAVYTTGVVYVPNDAVSFGLSFRRQDQANLTDADVTAITAALTLYAATDETVTIKGMAADAQGVRIKSLGVNGQIIDTDFEQGGYQSSTGTQSSTKRVRMKYAFFAQKGTYIRGAMEGLFYHVFELKTSDITLSDNTYGSSGWISGDNTYTTRYDSWIYITVANGQTSGSSTDIVPSDLTGKSIFCGNNAGEISNYLQYKRINNIEQGGYSSSSGTSSSTNKLRVAKMEFVPAGSRVLFNIGELYVYIWELSSNSRDGGNLIAGNGDWKQLSEYVVRNNCWLMMAFENGQDNASSTAITPADFDGYYWQIVSTPNVVNVTRANYETTDSDLATQVLAYASRFVGKTDVDSFAFFTDLHIVGGWNWRNVFIDAIKRIGTVYDIAPVDFCVFGGDALTRDSSYDASITPGQALYYLAYQDKVCRDLFGDDRYVPMAGNHDYNYHGTALLTESDIVNAMFRNQGKAYYKYVANHSTMYVLNTGNTSSTSMTAYRWEQIDWLGKALLADNPKHSIIALHVIKNNTTGNPIVPLTSNAFSLCAAYNAGESITLNGETYDFSTIAAADRGRVEMFLGGHLHSDVNYDGIESGIPYVMRSASGLRTIVPSFDCVLCDWEGREVTFNRFGTGYSMRINLDTGEEIIENE